MTSPLIFHPGSRAGALRMQMQVKRETGIYSLRWSPFSQKRRSDKES